MTILAWVLVMLGSAVPVYGQSAVETWTHPNQPGNINADLTWTQGAGSLMGIVNNAANATGAGSGGGTANVTTNSVSMTVQATMVEITRPTPTLHVQSCIHANQDRVTLNSYMFCARRDDPQTNIQPVTTGNIYFIAKALNGVFTPLLHDYFANIVNGNIMTLIVDHAAGTVTSFVNGVQTLQVVDSDMPNLTGRFAGISYLSTDTQGSTTFDDWSVSPASVAIPAPPTNLRLQ